MAGLANCARIIGLVAALTTASLSLPASGQERLQSQTRQQFYIPGLEEFGDLLGREYLTGEWGGLRPKLRDLGVVPTAVFATDVLGNPIGGNRHGLRETNDLTVDVAVDLERLVGWTGGRFDVSLSLRSGTSLTSADIGNVFDVSQLCCGHTYRLVNVYLEQSLFGDALNIRAGRITAGDEFLSSPLYWTFLQSAFNLNPGGILFNIPFPTYPIATWGARLQVKPVEALSVMAGAFNADATIAENGKHGVDWSMRGPLLAIGEIGYRLNQEEHATGLPGNYKVGGFFADGPFPLPRRAGRLRDAVGASRAAPSRQRRLLRPARPDGVPARRARQRARAHALRGPARLAGSGHQPDAVLRQRRARLSGALPLASPGSCGPRNRVRGVQPAAPAGTARRAEPAPDARGGARADLHPPGVAMAAGAARRAVHHQSGRDGQDPRRARDWLSDRGEPVRAGAVSPRP